MTGSTFIHEVNAEKLTSLGETGADALDDFTVVDMDTMMALDFTAMCGAVQWHQGEPAVIGDGLVVVQVAPAALDLVLGSRHEDLQAEQRADIERLRSFVAKHGTHHVWEYATF